MIHSQRKLRMGRIDFTNVWPVFHYFPTAQFNSSIEVVTQVPTQLNKGMQDGTIDVGVISSFAYAQSYQRYYILPNLSVSAFRSVHSILLFYKDSLERVKNGRIALTTSSATSVNLLKIILEKFHEGKPEYSFSPPSLHDMMDGMDGALLIGDDAIQASWQNHGYKVLDLGEEWTRLTNHWMTFALWVVQRETVHQYPELMNQIQTAFLDSKRRGHTDPSGIITAAIERTGGNSEFWSQYFSDLSYDFSEDQMQGLLLYYRYAFELGLLSEEVKLNIWNNNNKI